MSGVPQLTTSHRPGHSVAANYQQSGRWRHWYAAIVDLMISEPGITIKAIGERLNKHYSTISAITSTDNFKTYFAHRRKEWEGRHDFAVREKTQRVGMQALDLMIEHMEQKRTAVPLSLLTSIADKSFERLGYGPKAAPAAVTNVNVNNGQQIVQLPSVTPEALLEAREALRRAESHHLPMIGYQVVEGGGASEGNGASSAFISRSDMGEDSRLTAAPDEKEMELAPVNLSSE
jgi:hypothetical protein